MAVIGPVPVDLGQVNLAGDAVGNYPQRQEIMALIGPIPNPNLGEDGGQTQLLGDLVGSFSRFAGNQQTAYDGGASSASGGTNVMQHKVLRAWSQVLGRAPGRGPDSFMQALNGAFPTATDGSGVATVPVRSAVSMYNPDGLGTMATLAGSYGGQLSVGQAALFRQANLIASDAQKVLAGLQPFAPNVDMEQVEALRTLLGSQIKNLVQEFGRVDEPRTALVNTYMNGLGNTLQAFGTAALFVNVNQGYVTSDSDAAQIAGFALLTTYVQNLDDAWAAYRPQHGAFDPADPAQLSLRLERANILLPGVAQANGDFRASMASVGFSESEQRSVANRFNSLDPNATLLPILPLPLATMTPGDLADWADSLNIEGLSLLSESGRYGLEFVTDQADGIFWVIAPVLIIAQGGPPPGLPHPILLQYLENERVTWALNNLLTQLDGLADLAIPLPVN